MTINVRPATAADLPALATLFHEMEVHYDGPAAAPPESVIREALARHVFARESRVDLLVAEAGSRLLGFAFLSTLFPAAHCTPALFLKDIFVSAGERSRGVGLALMRAVARLAAARNCSRINWNTARDNAAALAFYAKLGARPWDDVVSLRLDGPALARLASEGNGD
jgi:GNAT superfamily N-acetyltransferase